MPGPSTLSDAIAASNARDEMWYAIVEHADGELEVHSWDGNAARIPDAATARGGFFPEEPITGDAPATCDAAAAAGISLLNSCPRCE